jgi:purine/pyrimidine-nucleoside phosphorylase
MSSTSFTHVTVEAKANIYFDGRVVSHSLLLEDGSKKTLGLIYPGKYHFGTAAPELMEIIAGKCSIVIDGTEETREIEAGSSFEVAANSGFTISVEDGICEYICSFLPA